MRQFVWRQAWHFCVLRSMQKAMQRGSNGTQSRTSQNSLQAYGYGGGARRSNNVPVAFRDMSLASGERAESFVPARSTTCPSGRPERLSRAPKRSGALVFPEVSGPGHVYRQYAVKRCLTTINCRQLRPAVLLETGGISGDCYQHPAFAAPEQRTVAAMNTWRSLLVNVGNDAAPTGPCVQPSHREV